MQAKKTLADGSTVSVKTAHDLSNEIRKSFDRRIKKLLSAYDEKWVRDESLIDPERMGGNYDLYLALYDARRGFSAVSGQLIVLI